jgi:hypothetical protein
MLLQEMTWPEIGNLSRDIPVLVPVAAWGVMAADTSILRRRRLLSLALSSALLLASRSRAGLLSGFVAGGFLLLSMKQYRLFVRGVFVCVAVIGLVGLWNPDLIWKSSESVNADLIYKGHREKGLLGSKYYTQQPLVPLGKTALNLNFDMILPLGVPESVVVTGAAKGIGALNWTPDRDQVVRRVALVYRLGEGFMPSLAAEALRVAQGASTFVLKASNASGETAFGTLGISSGGFAGFKAPLTEGTLDAGVVDYGEAYVLSVKY